MIRPLLRALAGIPLLAVAAGAGPARDNGRDHRLALHCAKAVTCAADLADAQVVDDAVILVEEGRVRAVGKRRTLAVPAGFEVVDLGDAWVVPGMIDLHSHIGHTGMLADWHTGTYLANPGLRVSSSVEPGNRLLQRAVAGGVTAVLYIPGSATNMGGQGVLLKTAPTEYERGLIRDPGSLKIAQAGNPEWYTIGVARTFMNWNLRNVLRRGVRYAERWLAFERGEGPEPEVDPQFEIFRALVAKETQISVHTQIYQVVLMTLTMLRAEFGFDVYIDHGTFDGFRAGALAEELEVPAILGPRSIARSIRARGFAEFDLDGRIRGVAAGYAEEGHTRIGFNTDATNFSSGIMTEELPLQGAMGARYGLPNDRLQVLRGLTIVPAQTAGIDDRLGSIEPGKDADLVVVSGDPTDPRHRVLRVYIEGEPVYDRGETPATW